jgi:pimeloyl-ACP methyl ester carboxylesterase
MVTTEPRARGSSVVHDVRLPGRGRCRVRHLRGPVGAPTVVLLHGWTATADLNWGRCYAALGEQYEVIAPDLRGHGGGVRGRFSLEACADDTAALLTALGKGPVILVGYSLGGPVATLVWRRHPQLVTGLVLCSTAAYFAGTRPEHLALSTASACARLGRRLPASARRTLRALLRQTWAKAEGALPEAALSQAAVDVLGHHDPVALGQAAGSLRTYRAGAWLGSISVPSAVVMTTRDRLVPPYRQHHLASAIPDCSLFSVEGDHAACATRPERFLPSLLAALGDVARRAAPSRLSPGHGQVVA